MCGVCCPTILMSQIECDGKEILRESPEDCMLHWAGLTGPTIFSYLRNSKTKGIWDPHG